MTLRNALLIILMLTLPLTSRAKLHKCVLEVGSPEFLYLGTEQQPDGTVDNVDRIYITDPATGLTFDIPIGRATSDARNKIFPPAAAGMRPAIYLYCGSEFTFERPKDTSVDIRSITVRVPRKAWMDGGTARAATPHPDALRNFERSQEMSGEEYNAGHMSYDTDAYTATWRVDDPQAYPFATVKLRTAITRNAHDFETGRLSTTEKPLTNTLQFAIEAIELEYNLPEPSPVPTVTAPAGPFVRQTEVTVTTEGGYPDGTRIYVTYDGSRPTTLSEEHTASGGEITLTLDRTATVRAVAIQPGDLISEPSEALEVKRMTECATIAELLALREAGSMEPLLLTGPLTVAASAAGAAFATDATGSLLLALTGDAPAPGSMLADLALTGGAEVQGLAAEAAASFTAAGEGEPAADTFTTLRGVDPAGPPQELRFGLFADADAWREAAGGLLTDVRCVAIGGELHAVDYCVSPAAPAVEFRLEPDAGESATDFLLSARLTITAPGATVSYSLDGGEETPSDPDTPLLLTATCTVTARAAAAHLNPGPESSMTFTRLVGSTSDLTSYLQEADGSPLCIASPLTVVIATPGETYLADNTGCLLPVDIQPDNARRPGEVLTDVILQQPEQYGGMARAIITPLHSGLIKLEAQTEAPKPADAAWTDAVYSYMAFPVSRVLASGSRRFIIHPDFGTITLDQRYMAVEGADSAEEWDGTFDDETDPDTPVYAGILYRPMPGTLFFYPTSLVEKEEKPEEPEQPENPVPDTPEPPDEPKPDEPTPDEPNPDEPKPDEPKPDEPTPDEPEPDTPEPPDEPNPDEPTPDEPTPDEPEPDTPEPDEPTPDEPEPDTPAGEEAAEADPAQRIYADGGRIVAPEGATIFDILGRRMDPAATLRPGIYIVAVGPRRVKIQVR